MDAIFAKTKSIFSVVRVANEEPRRYGKNGEVLIKYDETDMAQRRRSSAAGPGFAQLSFKKNSAVENENV